MNTSADAARRIPGAFRTGGTGAGVGVALLVVGLLAPSFAPTAFDLELMELVVVYGLVSISLNVMVGYLGYLPFSQIAFFGLGGYTGAVVARDLTTNLWVGLGLAVAFAAAASLVVGLLTLRMRGLYFAIITLALAQMFGLLVTDLAGTTGGTNGITVTQTLRLPLPGTTIVLDEYSTAYKVTLVFSVVVVVVLWLVMRSGFGRVAAAVRDNESLARSLGVRATAVKLVAFVLVSSVGAVAGVLYFAYFSFVSPGTFDLQSSLLLLLMIVLGGKGYFWTPIIGAALFEIVPNVVSLSDDVKWLLFGAIMLLVVTLLPDGLGGAAARLYRHLRPRPDVLGEQDLDRRAHASVLAPTRRLDAPVALAVRGVSRTFGGIRALDDVGFELRAGEVLGLIGPNGSGKTTMFNLVSGFFRPDSGRIELGGADITGLAPERIAARGLVRTFQEEAAFPGLTVAECELVARVAGGSASLIGQLGKALVSTVGHWAGSHTLVSELSHGSQRLLGIALAFASAPSVIMLDEPAAGLGSDEAAAISDMIRAARDHGVSIILIEHHMEMVMDVCDRVVVLGSGRELATGTPREVTADPAVVAAYLGSFGEQAAASRTRPTAVTR